MWVRVVCAFVALLWAASAWGQVTITGPIRTPTGEPWDGELRIQSQMMFCGGVTYPPTLQRVKVVNGQLNVSVQPTDVCGTGYSYTVYYVRWGRTEHVTYWIVPSTPTTTTVSAVQTSVVPTPQLMLPLSQLGTPGPAGSVIVSSGTAWVPGSAMVDVTQAVGDMIYRGSAGTLTRLPVGTAGQVLSSDGSVPVWSAPSGGGTWGSITGILSDQTDLWGALSGKASASHTHAAGDIVSGTMAAARLGGGTPAASTFLRGDSIWAGVDWASITGKPSVFPPSSHSHLLADLGQSGAATGQVPKWNGSAWVPASDDTGGSPSWGSITGTLSDQVDLQAALDGKASTSHTHAATDITSGTMAPQRLGSGTPSSSTYLRGDGVWAAVPGSSNYSQSFSSETLVVLAHNRGTTDVIVSCYDASDVEVIPQSVSVLSADAVSVGFSEPTTGRCVVNASGVSISQTLYQAGLDFGSIGGGTCAELNITAAGVTPGSTIAPGWPSALPMGITGMMYAGSDVIVVRLCNVTPAVLDPPSATYSARVIGGV